MRSTCATKTQCRGGPGFPVASTAPYRLLAGVGVESREAGNLLALFVSQFHFHCVNVNVGFRVTVGVAFPGTKAGFLGDTLALIAERRSISSNPHSRGDRGSYRGHLAIFHQSQNPVSILAGRHQLLRKQRRGRTVQIPPFFPHAVGAVRIVFALDGQIPGSQHLQWCSRLSKLYAACRNCREYSHQWHTPNGTEYGSAGLLGNARN